MSLFKKKKEVETAACCCGGSDAVEASAEKETSACCGEKVDGVCSVKALGSGCASCHALYENACKAVKDSGLEIEVEYITDFEKIMSYGVMSMPALVVNEKVVSVGKTLKASDIVKLLVQS
ncbi:MAG: thioredoxin family protein [Lentisphaeria bacterium]|nr:thioredoxin family protein [Lentisphaeria bacterium]